MYQLSVNGKPYGEVYKTKEEAQREAELYDLQHDYSTAFVKKI